MDGDKFALAEKIIRDVYNVMAKNAELCSFEVIPQETNYHNKSPVMHLDNCFGLESWCVKHVYMYCYSEVMDKYFAKPKRKALKLSTANSGRLTKLLNILLLLNPDLTSLWNKRREMVLNSFLERSVELRFTRLVLSRKPKNYDAFCYRRWLLEDRFKDESLLNHHLQEIVNEELSISACAAESSPNNYHSWNHRIWVINMLKAAKQYGHLIQYVKEYEFSERWTSKHVSDYSCFHYRQFCIQNLFSLDKESWEQFIRLLNRNLRHSFISILDMYYPNNGSIQVSRADLVYYSEDNLIKLLLGHTFKNCRCIIDNVTACRRLDVLFHELSVNNELIRFYKHHETLWYHRRFVLHEIIAIMYDYFGVSRQNGALIKITCKKCNVDDLSLKQAKIVRYDSNHIYASVLFNVVLSHERKFVEERRNDGDNYADRHENYLKFAQGLNNVM